jgi:hypothetical protein
MLALLEQFFAGLWMTYQEASSASEPKEKPTMVTRTPNLARYALAGRMFLALSLVIGLTACGGPPNWVKKGSGVMNAKDNKAFHGVGAVKGIKNEPLAWDAAENRARADIAKQFETYTAYLMRDYAASTTAADFVKSAEEQNVERAIKTFTSITLSGVRKIDQYKDEKTGTYYVLTRLNLEDAKESLTQAKELNTQVRDFVRKNAERLFDRLEKEEDKRDNK